MKDQELDRILSSEAGLVPSSGFASSVMDAVRNEASAPPPIPFPWKRALPGIAAGVLALVVLLIGALRQSGDNSVSAPSLLERTWSSLTPALQSAQMFGAGWIAAALILTYISVKVSLLLARNRA
jgi:hypothetical protein